MKSPLQQSLGGTMESDLNTYVLEMDSLVTEG